MGRGQQEPQALGEGPVPSHWGRRWEAHTSSLNAGNTLWMPELAVTLSHTAST